MRTKNKLILGASSLSLIPLPLIATLSCSNERTPEENLAILNANAALVQISVYDKDSGHNVEHIRTNISDVYSSYVSSIDDVKFHGFDAKKYEVSDLSFENLNTKTIVKFKLKDIKTNLVSDGRTYTISGFRKNPQYEIALTDDQKRNVEMFKNEMAIESKTNISAKENEFKELVKHVSSIKDYNEDQFNKDISNYKDYIDFLQKNFENENYKLDFNVDSYGEYLDHKVNEFEEKYPNYNESLRRLLTLKDFAFLSDPKANGLENNELAIYIDLFKNKVKSNFENPYFKKNEKLINKYEEKINNILKQVITLEKNLIPTEDNPLTEQAKTILDKYDRYDLDDKNKIKFVVLSLLNNQDGGNKLISDLESELKDLEQKDLKINLNDQQKRSADKFKELIKYVQDKLAHSPHNKNAKISNDEFLPYRDEAYSKNEVLEKENEFWEALKPELGNEINKWYKIEQFNEDLKTVDKFTQFLQDQEDKIFDGKTHSPWDFEVKNLADYVKFNVDSFDLKYPKYHEAIVRLNSLKANKFIEKNEAIYDIENLEELSNQIIKYYEEVVSNPLLRYKKYENENATDELKTITYREDFGKNNLLNDTPLLWDIDLKELNLNNLGIFVLTKNYIEDLILSTKPETKESKIEQLKFIYDDYGINPEYVKKPTEFILYNYNVKLAEGLLKTLSEYDKVLDYRLTNKHYENAEKMANWIIHATVELPKLRNIEITENNFDQFNNQEKTYWEKFDLSKYPIYDSNNELFKKDLDFYTDFIKFLQNETKRVDIDFAKSAKENENLDVKTKLTNIYEYYEANVDLFAIRFKTFKEALGRLNGLEAYNWISEQPEKITQEAIDNLYEEQSSKASNLFFKDISAEAKNMKLNFLSEKFRDYKSLVSIYTEKYTEAWDEFNKYHILNFNKDDAKLFAIREKFIDQLNHTFNEGDEKLHDRYFQYKWLTNLNKIFEDLKKEFGNIPVAEKDHNAIESVKKQLEEFDPSRKDSDIEFIKNKVTIMLSRGEGKKTEYTLEKFLGENYSETKEIKGDLGTVAKFYNYLSNLKEKKVDELKEQLDKNAKNDAVKEYSLEQYVDANLGSYELIFEEYIKAMTNISSYVAESFIEKENLNVSDIKDNEIKFYIFKYVIEFYEFALENKEFIENASNNEIVDELLQMSENLVQMSESNWETTDDASKVFNFNKLKRDYFIGLPNNSIGDANFIRLEELSKFILKLKAFKAKFDLYKENILIDKYKENAKLLVKSLTDDKYIYDDLEKVKKDLLDINKEFIHDDHEADKENNIDKHSYTENMLEQDVELIIDFYEKAKILKNSLEKVVAESSGRGYVKAIDFYITTYLIAQVQYERALERIRKNKLDLYKLNAKELNETEKVNRFDTKVQENSNSARTSYFSARSTQTSLLTLFRLDKDNKKDSSITKDEVDKKIRELLKDKTYVDANGKTLTSGERHAYEPEAINQELRQFISNIKQVKEHLPSTAETKSE